MMNGSVDTQFKDSVVAIAERLIGFRSFPGTPNLDIVGWITGYLRDRGVSSELIKSPDGWSANLLACIGPQVEGGVVLSGHTDVVVVDGQAWSSDPFTVRLSDGRLFGRGSADMKGFLAVCLAKVPSMMKAGLSRPIYLAFSYDEEIGCQGVPYLIERMKVLPAISSVIVGEPSEMDLVTAHKGAVGGSICLHGVDAHSSTPHLGVSAIRSASDLVRGLTLLEDELKSSAKASSAFVPGYSTINVSRISGGTADNIIPGRCELSWGLRLMPDDDAGRLITRIEDEVRRIETRMKCEDPRCIIDFTVRAVKPGLREQSGGPALALAKLLSGKDEGIALPYLTEAGFFQEAGFSSIVCGPGSINQAHKPDEYVEISQLMKCGQFIQRLIDHLAS